MDEILAFWRARLDELEQAAQAATPGPWSVGDETPGGSAGFLVIPVNSASLDERDNPVAESLMTPYVGDRARADAAHIAANDPASVLADIEADRALIAMYEEQAPRHLPKGAHDGRDPEERECDAAVKAALEHVARIRVAKYASHPGYQEAWRP